MAASLRKTPVPPIGIIGALTSGFETVSTRLELILLPLALDLFLWLGPHLSVQPLFDCLIGFMREVASADAGLARSLEPQFAILAELGQTYNLFSVLSTGPLDLPLGLPSLMTGRAPGLAPGGSPVVWRVDNPLVYLFLFGMFTLLGLLFSALYFGSIAQQVRDARLNLRRLVRQVWGDWARLTALLVLVIVGALALGIPVMIAAGLANLINPALSGFVLLAGWTLALWALFYSGFTLHGIILHRRGLFGALWDSLRLVQTSLPHTAGLYIVAVILSLGLGSVWNIPADNSWLLLLGVVGHALVSTALVTATFVFFKDRYRWWIEMRQALQAQGAKRSV